MTDAAMWFEIAKMIRYNERSGPFICNLMDRLHRDRRITNEQRAAVFAAVNKERDRQYGVAAGQVLWRDIFDHDLECALRIRFCAQQIRRLARRASHA